MLEPSGGALPRGRTREELRRGEQRNAGKTVLGAHIRLVQVHVAVTKVFALMQKQVRSVVRKRGAWGADGSCLQGFFCQLPFDPARTEIGACAGDKGARYGGGEELTILLGAECQRIEKIIERTR